MGLAGAGGSQEHHVLSSTGDDLHTATTITLMRTVARRCCTLQREAADHHQTIEQMVTRWRPDLLGIYGVGPIVAAIVLCAWSHPGRWRNEAAFATLGAVAPIAASSGKTVRHRLNRGGDRQLNQAIYTIVLVRWRNHPATLAYVTRRRNEA